MRSTQKENAAHQKSSAVNASPNTRRKLDFRAKLIKTFRSITDKTEDERMKSSFETYVESERVERHEKEKRNTKTKL